MIFCVDQNDTGKNENTSKPVADYTDDIRQLFNDVRKKQLDSRKNKDSHSPNSRLAAYRKAMWDSLPTSKESALNTAEEKLRETRESIRETKEMFLKLSYENNTDSIDLSQFLGPGSQVSRESVKCDLNKVCPAKNF